MIQTLSRRMNEQVCERLRLHGWTFVRDAIVIGVAYYLAELMRFDGPIPTRYYNSLVFTIPAIVCVWSLGNYLFGIHRRIWKYAGMPDVRAMADASLVSVLAIALLDIAFPDGHLLPLTVIPVGGAFTSAGLLGLRIWPRLIGARHNPVGDCDQVLIVGAGQAGQLVATELLQNPQWEQHPAGFLDDDMRKRARCVCGVPVLGSVADLPRIVSERHIDIVGVAIPSASQKQIERILAIAQSTAARVQILPSRGDIIRGRAALRLRDLDLEDILGRTAEVDPRHTERIRTMIEGRVVLVTGARGSIGFELCQQVLELEPARLLCLDNNETGLFYLQRDLARHANARSLSPILADITDAARLERIFQRYRPDIVFHAAAYKHVPMLEAHPEEAVFVNVQGTANLCRLARETGCKRFVFISTDKAVEPVNALGFSKRIGELLVRAHGGAGTIFCSVRFGNVVGTRGSALPEFIRQIDAGGPVTVTHPDVERFFMTISEAVRLVIQAGALAEGGELFMLDMGEPLKIVDVVKRIIRLRGLRIGKDIQIEFTGLRPGEKLTEELVFAHEEVRTTDNPGICVVEDTVSPDLAGLEQRIAFLGRMASLGDAVAIHAALRRTATEVGLTTHRGLIGVG